MNIKKYDIKKQIQSLLELRWSKVLFKEEVTKPQNTKYKYLLWTHQKQWKFLLSKTTGMVFIWKSYLKNQSL